MNKITPKDQEPKVEETIPNETTGETKADDVAELEKVDETADTVKLEMPNGEQVDVDKAELEKPEEITLQPMAEETCTCETEDRCADHISRTKILDVIESTMARYDGKVVLAMYEVKNIIDTIIKAVKE